MATHLNKYHCDINYASYNIIHIFLFINCKKNEIKYPGLSLYAMIQLRTGVICITLGGGGGGTHFKPACVFIYSEFDSDVRI